MNVCDVCMYGGHKKLAKVWLLKLDNKVRFLLINMDGLVPVLIKLKFIASNCAACFYGKTMNMIYIEYLVMYVQNMNAYISRRCM